MHKLTANISVRLNSWNSAWKKGTFPCEDVVSAKGVKERKNKNKFWCLFGCQQLY